VRPKRSPLRAKTAQVSASSRTHPRGSRDQPRGLRAAGSEIEDDEVQTAASTAVALSSAQRVLAMTMHASSATRGHRARRRFFRGPRGGQPARRRGDVRRGNNSSSPT